jgi:site-specific DNA-methyltransferase (adenine-specific)
VSADRHPTEKPIALLSELISATTVEGDLVADPFGGVASTLVAATRTGRGAWGCELDEGYHETGKRRLDAADRGEEDPR